MIGVELNQERTQRSAVGGRFICTQDHSPLRFQEKKIHKKLLSRWRRAPTIFCFLKILSEVRILTTFYLAKNDHRWVTFIMLAVSDSSLGVDLSKSDQIRTAQFLLFFSRIRAGSFRSSPSITSRRKKKEDTSSWLAGRTAVGAYYAALFSGLTGMLSVPQVSNAMPVVGIGDSRQIGS